MATSETQVRDATTLDLLKLLAVAFMVVDHVGLYLVPDATWLRILGRPAAVIFGFLIGYSGSTRVPPTWIGLGIGLTLLENALDPDDDHALDILISLALTRMVVPYFDRLYAERPMLLVPAGIVLAAVAEPLNGYLEYGTEVTLVALVGVAVRLHRGQPEQIAGRDAIALLAAAGMSLIAIRHFELVGREALASAVILTVTMLLLSRFTTRPIRAPFGIGRFLHFAGRNTLWIYALHLAALQLTSWWIDPEGE